MPGSARSPRPAAPKKLLVANRSEIAIRVMRAATELGLRTVAIYAEEDRFSMHRFKADEAYRVGEGKGPGRRVSRYRGDHRDRQGARRGSDPSRLRLPFGECEIRARLPRRRGSIWVGPKPELLELMGDKVAARALTQKLKVPTLPGTEDPVSDRARGAARSRRNIGFPLIIKAAFGGGGRGMRVVHKAGDLDALLDEAQGEAERAFGNPAVFLEKYIPRAKHIEVQVLGDRHGNVLHLHERDCSVQRRHQKVVEIAPERAISMSACASELCDAAARIAQEIGYDNAGTIEFLYDLDTQRVVLHRDESAHPGGAHGHRADHRHRPRALANPHRAGRGAARAGARPAAAGGRSRARGFAVQCRVTTEDPENKFTPNYGKILTFRSAGGFGIRLDAGMGDAGAVITPFYDSLLVKITASGADLRDARSTAWIARCASSASAA